MPPLDESTAEGRKPTVDELLGPPLARRKRPSVDELLGPATAKPRTQDALKPAQRDTDTRPSLMSRVVGMFGKPVPGESEAITSPKDLAAFGKSAGQAAITGTGAAMKGAPEMTSRRAILQPFYNTYLNFPLLSPEQQLATRRAIIGDPHLSETDKGYINSRLGSRLKGERLSEDDFAQAPPEETGLYRGGKAVEEFGRKTFPTTKEEQESLPGRTGAVVGGAIPALAAGVAGSAVGAPELGLAVGAAQMGLSSASEQAEQARATGASPRATVAAAQSGGIT